MKNAACITLLATAVLSKSAVDAVAVEQGQWNEVYAELSQCLSSMGFCRDTSPQPLPDYGVELNYKTKAQCVLQNNHVWVEPFPTVKDLKTQVEARDAEDGSTADLFLLRRLAGIPVTSGLSGALEESIKQGSYEGYVRCGGHEYVYMYGEKDSVYNSVKSTYETIQPFGIPLYAFDAAFPVPDELRVSPYVTVAEASENCADSANPTKICPGFCADKSPLNDGDIISNGICPGKVELKVILADNKSATVADAEKIATSLSKHLVNTSGRRLSEADFTIKAASRRNLVVSGISHRELLVASGQFIAGEGSPIVWIEPQNKFTSSNFDAALITQTGNAVPSIDGYPTDNAAATPFWAAGLTGKNQVVGVGDSGFDTSHCMFQDGDKADNNRTAGVDYPYEGHRKLTNYWAFADGGVDPGGDHGTHVAGSVAGDVFAEAQTAENELTTGHRGMAYDAKISFFDIGAGGEYLSVPEDIYNDYLEQQYKYGARIQTNSWGVRFGNYYSDTAKGMDKYSWDHQDFLILVAAGNSGNHVGSLGSIGSPATAKNVLSVGASTNSDRNWEGVVSELRGNDYTCSLYSNSEPCESGLAFFSSNGPTYDGRIKPDVVAPGFFISSALSESQCGLAPFAGTSMATPVTAGNVALMRQYLMEGFYPSGKATAGDEFTPMGALLKAITINSGVAMMGTYADSRFNQTTDVELSQVQMPNSYYGFGLTQLDTTLPLEGHNDNTLFLDGDVDNMSSVENWMYNAYEFEVTGDAANLKITLVWHDPEAQPAARDSLVNDLDLQVFADGLEYFPNNMGTKDTLNNVEQTVISDVTQRVVVRVSGYSVPFGPQPYALVVNGDADFKLVNKFTGKLFITEVEESTDPLYYLIWLFGGIAVGGGLFFAGNKFANKKRNSTPTETDEKELSSFQANTDNVAENPKFEL